MFTTCILPQAETDAEAAVYTEVACIGCFLFLLLLKQLKVVPALVARKLMHIGMGPVFVLFWLLFPDASPWSRYYAALVPLSITVYFLLVGLEIVNGAALVAAVSRSGKRAEILKGPLYYGIIHVIAPILFWKQTPTGAVSLLSLCLGDGFADVVGRAYGHSNKLPWNRSKSFAGSSAFFICSFIASVLFVGLYRSCGLWLADALPILLLKLAVLIAVAAGVESLPVPGEADNITVFVGGAACSLLLWRQY